MLLYRQGGTAINASLATADKLTFRIVKMCGIISFHTCDDDTPSTYLDSEQLTDIAEYYHSRGQIDDAVSVATIQSPSRAPVFRGCTEAGLEYVREAVLSRKPDSLCDCSH